MFNRSSGRLSDAVDNGTDQIVMEAKQVFDGIGNPVAPGTIGSFTVTAPLAHPHLHHTRPATRHLHPNGSTDGRSVLIGGFIIRGNDPKEVVLRAIGPSLAGFGISNPLADPVLELHGSDGSLITTNDNWKDTQQSEIEASGFQPQDDLESAILSTLEPVTTPPLSAERMQRRGLDWSRPTIWIKRPTHSWLTSARAALLRRTPTS